MTDTHAPMCYLERLTQLPPNPDPIAHMQARLMRMVLLAVLAIAVVYTTLEALLLGFAVVVWPAALTAIYAGIVPLLLGMARRGHAQRASQVLVALLWVLLTVVVVLTGDPLLYPSISYYLIVIVAAAVLANWGAVVWVGVLSVLVTLGRLGWLWAFTPGFTAENVLVGLAGVFAMTLITVFLGITVQHARRVALRAYQQGEELAERNAALQAMVEQQRTDSDKLAQLFEHALDLMLAVDLESGKVAQVSPSVRALLGWGPAEFVGLAAVEVVHPDDRERVQALGPLFLSGGRVYDFEVRLRHRDGGYRSMSWNGWYVGGYVYGVARDLTAQREMMRQEQALALQQQMLKTQQHFISVMYHELKTPLTVMNVSADLIRDERLPQDRRNKHLDRITNQVKHMNDLVNQTLRLRRLIDPSYPLEPQTFSLRPFVAQLADEAEGLASDREIIVTVAPDVPDEMTTDPDVLRHTLANLLSNALKYSDDTVSLTVSYDSSVQTCHFAVQDRGVGIPPEDLPHIFEPFYRASNTERRPGTGLGLSIAHDGIVKVGGSIYTESEPGQGSVFHVRVPVALSRGPLQPRR